MINKYFDEDLEKYGLVTDHFTYADALDFKRNQEDYPGYPEGTERTSTGNHDSIDRANKISKQSKSQVRG